MKTRRILRTLRLSALAAALCGCAPAPRNEGEGAAVRPTPARQTEPAQRAPTQAAADAAPAAPKAPTAPPPAADVRAALERTYGGAVAFDERAVVGDFNGDGSEDLVAAVRPAPGRAAELNGELVNWIVTDPLSVRPPDPRDFDPHQGVQKLAPTTRPPVAQGDALLAVVHGYGGSGWRNPDARQTFLLKNVAGEALSPEPRAEARAPARGHTPRLFGDVLRERLGGAQGFLYWTGAGYGWFVTEKK